MEKDLKPVEVVNATWRHQPDSHTELAKAAGWLYAGSRHLPAMAGTYVDPYVEKLLTHVRASKRLPFII